MNRGPDKVTAKGILLLGMAEDGSIIAKLPKDTEGKSVADLWAELEGRGIPDLPEEASEDRADDCADDGRDDGNRPRTQAIAFFVGLLLGIGLAALILGLVPIG